MAAETVEVIADGAEEAQSLGEMALAPVIELPIRPGMAATLAFVRWMERNHAEGYGVCGVAEYRHDENDRLYIIDQRGEPLYLTD